MEKYRVFYLDDDDDDIELFLLATENFNNVQVIVFTDGHTMLRNLNLVKRTPNALFLDVNMPKIDGYEIIKEVRGHNRFNGMAVVVLTGTGPREVEKFRLIGANYFVIKPVTIDKLRRTLRHVFDMDFEAFVPTTENFVLKDIDALAS